MEKNVAIYWDFENIHASFCSVRLGSDWYRKNRFSKQPKLVDIRAVMAFVRACLKTNNHSETDVLTSRTSWLCASYSH
jgi:hypothetical protein